MDRLVSVTPLTLASDLERSIAYLHDVVGYGRLPGESSRLESFAKLSCLARATVLAWYWPRRGYGEGFDPFAEFHAVSQSLHGARDAQLSLRALAADRFEGFLVSAFAATMRMPDEIAGAVCWRSTCSGDRLIGVLDGTQGFTFEQFLAAARTLGLRYIDPVDDASVVSSWTSAPAEIRRSATEFLEAPVNLALALARNSLLDRFLHDETAEASQVWQRLMERRPVDLTSARSALEDHGRLDDSSQIGLVVADLVVGHDDANHAPAVELLNGLLADISDDQAQLLADSLQSAARYLDTVPIDPGAVDQGFGWFLLDRADLGERVDEALAELGSISAARATIRKRFDWSEDRPSIYRPGDTYTAPALGTRYRGLYEALATTAVQVPTLDVDPAAFRIRTARGWIDLPPSAIRDRAWWSGSGQSVTGRPQVRAWWAAGYGSPKLATNDDGLIVSAQFPPLPGREDWLQEHSTEERLASGRYTVPPAPNTPYHAAFTYGGPSVWQMDNEQFAALRTSLTGSRPATAPDRSENSSEEAQSSETVRTDADQIGLLVQHLRQHGESGRREIEALFATQTAKLSDDLDLAKWLPNLLAKARRQRRIANIGTRKQPRWVAAGTAEHLATQLSNVLGQDEHGNQVAKITAPKLAPAEPVPARLYRDVIRHAFPGLTPEPLPPGAFKVGVHNGDKFLTDEAMSAVLAGRTLTDNGVAALLKTIALWHEAAWDAAAAAAAPDSDDMGIDEDEILAG